MRAVMVPIRDYTVNTMHSKCGADGGFGYHNHARSFSEVRGGGARWCSKPAKDKSHTLAADKKRLVRRLTSKNSE